jgi:RNA polymerase sigma-70 factor (ECF subfamily)
MVVRQALAALPVEQRAALVLVDVQGYPVAEAAEILGVAEGTIKSRCARGRARMAVALGHLRPGSPSPSTSLSAMSASGDVDRAGSADPAPVGDVRHAGAGNQAGAGRVPTGSGTAAPLPSAGDGRDQQ